MILICPKGRLCAFMRVSSVRRTAHSPACLVIGCLHYAPSVLLCPFLIGCFKHKITSDALSTFLLYLPPFTCFQISVLERKVDALEKLYGCQLVWKIENWTERMREAKLGRKAAIFSPPFLTSRHGYKMAMALSPYGDGKGTVMRIIKLNLFPVPVRYR